MLNTALYSINLDLGSHNVEQCRLHGTDRSQHNKRFYHLSHTRATSVCTDINTRVSSEPNSARSFTCYSDCNSLITNWLNPVDHDALNFFLVALHLQTQPGWSCFVQQFTPWMWTHNTSNTQGTSCPLPLLEKTNDTLYLK